MSKEDITVSSDADTHKSLEKFVSIAAILPLGYRVYRLNTCKTQQSLSSLQDAPTAAFSLKYFMSSMYATILEDSILEILILEECSNELRIFKTLADIVHLCAIKYKVTLPVVDPIDATDRKNLDKEEYKLNKLANDRKYMHEALIALYCDLSSQKSFRALVKLITDVKDKENYNAFLLEDESKNISTRRELARQLRLQRNHIKSVNYDTDLLIENLKSRVEDSVLQAETRSRYVTNWQVARTEQHHQSIKFNVSGAIGNIDYYKTRVEHEHRVHTEVELMNNINIKLQDAHIELIPAVRSTYYFHDLKPWKWLPWFQVMEVMPSERATSERCVPF